MPEQQNIEYKQNWHDDYLKWICGFANANGGTFYVGKDDNGNVVDVVDYKKLMEDLPNKILHVLGIMVEVNLRQENGRHYIEIITPPYPVPISYRGRYYYRTGSTKQELTGNALNGFLLKKSGKTWDDVIEQRATIADIDEKSVAQFLEAAKKAGRLPEDENSSLPELLDKLRLIENGQLKRAAIVLFGKDPGKFYVNMRVRIGRIKPIEFEGVHRIEKGEYPVAAVREMLLNALVHRDYMGSNTQIRMYDDKFCIWNEGFLPEGLSLESLKEQHPSRPRNPIIADVCFKGGYIDAWGRGIMKIFNACQQAGLPEPEIKEQGGGLLVTLFKDQYLQGLASKIGLNERQLKALKYVQEKGKISNKEYQEINTISKATATRELAKLVELKVFEQKGVVGQGTNYVLKSIGS